MITCGARATPESPAKQSVSGDFRVKIGQNLKFTKKDDDDE